MSYFSSFEVFYLYSKSIVNFVDGARLSISTAELKKVKVGEENTRASEPSNELAREAFDSLQNRSF